MVFDRFGNESLLVYQSVIVLSESSSEGDPGKGMLDRVAVSLAMKH